MKKKIWTIIHCGHIHKHPLWPFYMIFGGSWHWHLLNGLDKNLRYRQMLRADLEEILVGKVGTWMWTLWQDHRKFLNPPKISMGGFQIFQENWKVVLVLILHDVDILDILQAISCRRLEVSTSQGNAWLRSIPWHPWQVYKVVQSCTKILYILPWYIHITIITIILPSYYHHITIILPSYYHHITIILPSYYHHITIILPLYQHTQRESDHANDFDKLKWRLCIPRRPQVKSSLWTSRSTPAVLQNDSWQWHF